MPQTAAKSKVLITGVNGYVGAHIADQLLQEGYDVRGTVRSKDKGEFLQQRFNDPKYSGKFETCIVKDLEQKGAFKEAVPGCDIIMHVASPATWAEGEPFEKFINPAVNGTLSLLQDAHDHGNAKRVVLTSSYAAVLNLEMPPDYIYTEADWNTKAIELCRNLGEKAPLGVPYFASKAEGEMAAWKFMIEKKPKFTLAALNPVYVWGPAIQQMNSAKDINFSIQLVWEIASGAAKEAGAGSPYQNWVDVRDVARAHISAATIESAGGHTEQGHRFLLAAGGFSAAQVASIIQRRFPELKDKSTKPAQEVEKGHKEPGNANNTQAKTVLKVQFRELEETVVDTVESLKKFLI